ncbi:GNAT family N-acetyltransferase, partial [Lysobacter sp. 2RAB21]
HAYVRPGRQRSGVGAALLRHLRENAQRPVLVGTWADAAWAIAFYQRNGFVLVAQPRAAALLRSYWNIPERQIDTSVVLELPCRDGVTR